MRSRKAQAEWLRAGLQLSLQDAQRLIRLCEGDPYQGAAAGTIAHLVQRAIQDLERNFGLEPMPEAPAHV